MKLINEKFVVYLLENLNRGGAVWEIQLNNLFKTFDQTKITKENRIEFYYKREIQASIVLDRIRDFRATETTFLFEYSSLGKEKIQTVEIFKK